MRILGRTTTGVAALAVLAACAQGTSTDDDAADGNTEAEAGGAFDASGELSGELEIMGFGLGDDVATSRYELAEAALGGEVSIHLIEGALDIQQFLTSVASGDPPDLIYAARDQIGTFASRGAIVPLAECVAGEGIVIEDFRPAPLEQVTFADQVYGIPEFNSSRSRWPTPTC